MDEEVLGHVTKALELASGDVFLSADANEGLLQEIKESLELAIAAANLDWVMQLRTRRIKHRSENDD